MEEALLVNLLKVRPPRVPLEPLREAFHPLGPVDQALLKKERPCTPLFIHPLRLRAALGEVDLETALGEAVLGDSHRLKTQILLDLLVGQLTIVDPVM